jgi:hypothetical protein
VDFAVDLSAVAPRPDLTGARGRFHLESSSLLPAARWPWPPRQPRPTSVLLTGIRWGYRHPTPTPARLARLGGEWSAWPPPRRRLLPVVAFPVHSGGDFVLRRLASPPVHRRHFPVVRGRQPGTDSTGLFLRLPGTPRFSRALVPACRPGRTGMGDYPDESQGLTATE